MLYDKITLTHDDILLLSCLIENHIKQDKEFLSLYGEPYLSRCENAKRLQNEISALSELQNKLESIKSVTYK